MELMTATALAAWAWSTVSSGVVGNAAYEGVKLYLGEKFVKFQGYAQQGKEDSFKDVLQEVLEQNQALLQQLSELARQYPVVVPTQTITKTNSGSISTGAITSSGTVNVGHKNIIKR